MCYRACKEPTSIQVFEKYLRFTSLLATWITRYYVNVAFIRDTNMVLNFVSCRFALAWDGTSSCHAIWKETIMWRCSKYEHTKKKWISTAESSYRSMDVSTQTRKVFSEYILSSAKLIGKVRDYVIKIEFQMQGSPHAHCILWIEDAPKINHDSDEAVCNFVDKYITAQYLKTTQETIEILG